MSNQRLLCLTLVLLWWPTANASDRPRADAPHPAVTSTPLRTLSSVTLLDQGYMAWAGPPRCGEDGGVFFLTMPTADAKNAEPTITMPIDVQGISPDGKNVTHFRPKSVSAFSDADRITTGSFAVDSSGNVLLLVWVVKGEGGGRGGGGGREYIVSFDKTGKYRSKLEIPKGMAVGSFEMFGSGAFLLRGRQSEPDGARIAVMQPGGGELRDVIGSPTGLPDEPFDPPRNAGFAARGGDGRIFLASLDDEAIHVIDPSGDAERAVRLAPVPRTRRMRDLMASGSRLAVVYDDAKLDGGTWEDGRFWIDVYDTAIDERVASYGPVSQPPLCYEYGGSQDQFTLLGEGPRFVKMAP